MSHIHKLKRVKVKKVIYKCTECPSWYPEALAFGVKTICWKCGDEFILRKLKNNRVKPICDKCRGILSPEIDVDNLMKGLGLN
jgi:rRNA maturation endonuclease Nob1